MTVHLLADPSALAELRRRVGSLLALWGLSRATADTARLCVSELVTNVVRHVGEGVPITLRVAMTDGRPRLELTDPDPRALPTLLSATGEDETGRGLALLDAFAARWGVTQHAHAKTTWCELDAEPVPASGPAPEPASPAGPGCGPPPDRGAASRVEPGCARPLAPAPVPVPAPVPEDVRERP
ncbi:ATP-binding protein [Streptomyces sp. JJ36]|nr:ATP-binding protein [Streptomyces sp. JJ36]